MKNSCVFYLEETARQYPTKVAVRDEHDSYTFGQLRADARAIAACMEARLRTSEPSPIAVYLPKSCACIVSFAAILYSGNIYVPMDVKMPLTRAEKIFENLSPALVLTKRAHVEALEQIGIRAENILCIDEMQETDDGAAPCGYLSAVDTDPAYIIYTSGSTGVPKGVTVAHRGVLDYIDWARETYQVTSEDVLGSQSPFYFDNSTLDIYLCFSTGATLDIIPEVAFAFPVKLVRYLEEKKITSMFAVPSVLIQVANMDALSAVQKLSLKRVLFAGEVMPNKQLNYWRKHLPDTLFSNLYGPTEITVDCTYYIVDRAFRDDEPLPIGIPCRNSDVFLLDEEDHLVTEPGKRGELCVRGSSLALGYWNNPEKTAAAFTQNPLQAHYPERIYRTGDLAAWSDECPRGGYFCIWAGETARSSTWDTASSSARSRRRRRASTGLTRCALSMT